MKDVTPPSPGEQAFIDAIDWQHEHSNVWWWGKGRFKYSCGYEWFRFVVGISMFWDNQEISLDLDLGPLNAGVEYKWRGKNNNTGSTV